MFCWFFPYFGAIFTLWDGSNLGFMYILSRMHRMNAWHLAYWCILTTFRADKILAMICWFSSFWCNFDLDGSNLGFPCILRGSHGMNGLNFGILMYPAHLQNWLDYGNGLSIFLIWSQLWLCEMGQICQLRGPTAIISLDLLVDLHLGTHFQFLFKIQF